MNSRVDKSRNDKKRIFDVLRVNKILILYILLIVPFLKPAVFGNYFIIDKIYDVWFVTSCLGIFFLCWRQKYFPKLLWMVILYAILMLLSTAINGGMTISALKTMIEIPSIVLLVMFGVKHHCADFLKAIIIITAVLIDINFVTILVFPDGMYYNAVSHMSANFFLGMDNTHIVYFLIFWLACYTYWFIYNRCNKWVLITVLISVISIALRGSATTIIGCLIIAGYFLLRKFLDKSKFVRITTYVITYIVAYVGVVFLGVQKAFSFILENVFGKDVTFTNRLTIWQNTIHMIQAQPVIGYGLISSEQRNLIYGASHAHNIVLEILFEGGILLFGAFIGIVAMVLKKMSCFFDSKLTKTFTAMLFAFFVMMLMEAYSMPLVMCILAFCYMVDIFIDERKKARSKIDDAAVVANGGNHHDA